MQYTTRRRWRQCPPSTTQHLTEGRGAPAQEAERKRRRRGFRGRCSSSAALYRRCRALERLGRRARSEGGREMLVAPIARRSAARSAPLRTPPMDGKTLPESVDAILVGASRPRCGRLATSGGRRRRRSPQRPKESVLTTKCAHSTAGGLAGDSYLAMASACDSHERGMTGRRRGGAGRPMRPARRESPARGPRSPTVPHA